MIDLMSWRRVTTLNKNDATMEQGKELVKRKMKPRGGNSPVIGDNGVHTKPGDNSKIAGFLMEVGKWGPVDKSDVQAMEKRFWNYVALCFERDVRVTNQVAYFAIGITKDDVYNWENGLTRSSEHRDFIKKVKTFCGSYREMLGADGKLNPVTLVWWQKNYDGLVDKSEVVLTPNNPLGTITDQKQLEERIAGSVGVEE
mgnify:FL=1